MQTESLSTRFALSPENWKPDVPLGAIPF